MQKTLEVVGNPDVNPDVVDVPVDGLVVVRAVDLPEGCHQVNFVFVRFWEVQVDFLCIIKGCFHLYYLLTCIHFIQSCHDFQLPYGPAQTAKNYPFIVKFVILEI